MGKLSAEFRECFLNAGALAPLPMGFHDPISKRQQDAKRDRRQHSKNISRRLCGSFVKDNNTLEALHVPVARRFSYLALGKAGTA